mmetsp:Transcript_7331/g.14667  ORF Transcript_7331/g.14667 Transcript_7331/m.14667 type:complete len:306 (-) Transcript_7331:325-1242(-)
MLLDDRVLDVSPEASVGEVSLPLGHKVVACAVRRRLGSLVHEIGDVAPRELGHSELESRGGGEEHFPPLRADGHDHIDVLERETRLRVDDRRDLVRIDEETVVLDKLGLRPLLVVAAPVERAAEGVVMPHSHALLGVVLDEAQIGLRGMSCERAICLTLEEHWRRESVAGIGFVLLSRLERLQQLAAEEGVERVPVVVQEHRVLRFDVWDGIEPALHRACAQRQWDLGHLLPPLELLREVNARARLEVGKSVDEVDAGRCKVLEAREKAGQLRARVFHRNNDGHLVGQHLIRAGRVLWLHRRWDL